MSKENGFHFESRPEPLDTPGMNAVVHVPTAALKIFKLMQLPEGSEFKKFLAWLQIFLGKEESRLFGI